MKDISSINGKLKINIYQNGEIVRVIEQKNLVVQGGKRLIAQMLGAVSGLNLTKVRYGSGINPVSELDSSISNSPVPYTELIIDDAFLYPDNDVPINCVQFRFMMDSSTGNGKVFTECGLVNNAGTLFNRILLNEPIEKNNTFSFEGFWTIEIV